VLTIVGGYLIVDEFNSGVSGVGRVRCSGVVGDEEAEITAEEIGGRASCVCVVPFNFMGEGLVDE